MRVRNANQGRKKPKKITSKQRLNSTAACKMGDEQSAPATSNLTDDKVGPREPAFSASSVSKTAERGPWGRDGKGNIIPLTAIHSVRSTHCTLPTSNLQPPTAFRPLHSAHCTPPNSTHFTPPTAHHSPPTAHCSPHNSLHLCVCNRGNRRT